MVKAVRKRRTLRRLLKTDDGATAIEYGLVGALIAATLLAGLAAIGSSLSDQLTQLGSSIEGPRSANPAAGGGGNNGNGNGNGNGKGGNGQGNNGKGKGNGGPGASSG